MKPLGIKRGTFWQVDNVLVLLSTVLPLVIRHLRHQTGFEGGVKYGGRIGQEVKKERSRSYR